MRGDAADEPLDGRIADIHYEARNLRLVQD